MTSEQFSYWLQGFSEMNEEPPTPEQWTSIKEHLSTVFVKVTPDLTRVGVSIKGGAISSPKDSRAKLIC